jgi:hypothetical protein
MPVVDVEIVLAILIGPRFLSLRRTQSKPRPTECGVRGSRFEPTGAESRSGVDIAAEVTMGK